MKLKLYYKAFCVQKVWREIPKLKKTWLDLQFRRKITKQKSNKWMRVTWVRWISFLIGLIDHIRKIRFTSYERLQVKAKPAKISRNGNQKIPFENWYGFNRYLTGFPGIYFLTSDSNSSVFFFLSCAAYNPNFFQLPVVFRQLVNLYCALDTRVFG